MQEPPTIESSTSSNPVDPFNFFPPELFIQLLQFSNSSDNLDAAATSQKWRKAILKNPSLFCSLYFNEWNHDKEIHKGLTEAQHKAKAEKVIKRVMKMSLLNKHQLEEAEVIVKSFVYDATFSGHDLWPKTKLSVVFYVLQMSSDSLKRLSLHLTTEQSSDEFNLVFSIDHVTSIIKNLKPFKALQEVNIATEVNLGIGSGFSSDLPGKGLNLVERSEERDLFEKEWEYHVDYEAAVYSLFKEVNDFTGKDITRFDYNSNAGRCSLALRKLEDQQGRKLKDMDLYLRGMTDDYEECFLQATMFPELNSLSFIQYADGKNIPEEMHFKACRDESKLFSLTVKVEEGQIILDDTFAQWAGGNKTLEVLVLHQPFWEGGNSIFRRSPSIQFQSLQSLLHVSGASLVELDLEGVYLSSATATVQLILHNLRSLNLRGNHHLINLLMRAEFKYLNSISLVSEGKQSDVLDHLEIVEGVENCWDNIESFSFEVVKSKDGKQPVKKSSSESVEEVSDRSNAMFLPAIEKLDLQLDDDIILKFYLPIDYLNLSEVKLLPSSKLSLSSFTQRESSKWPHVFGK